MWGIRTVRAAWLAAAVLAAGAGCHHAGKKPADTMDKLLQGGGPRPDAKPANNSGPAERIRGGII